MLPDIIIDYIFLLLLCEVKMVDKSNLPIWQTAWQK
jgi:hypothetical protein